MAWWASLSFKPSIPCILFSPWSKLTLGLDSMEVVWRLIYTDYWVYYHTLWTHCVCVYGVGYNITIYVKTSFNCVPILIFHWNNETFTPLIAMTLKESDCKVFNYIILIFILKLSLFLKKPRFFSWCSISKYLEIQVQVYICKHIYIAFVLCQSAYKSSTTEQKCECIH